MRKTTWILLALFMLNMVGFTAPQTSEATCREILSAQDMQSAIGGGGQLSAELVYPHGASYNNGYEYVGTAGVPLNYILDVNNLTTYNAEYTITVSDNGSNVIYEETGFVAPFTSAYVSGALSDALMSGQYYYMSASVEADRGLVIAADTVNFHAK